MAENTSDIVFDCPHCNKSLAIDRRGAGMIITCPDCQQSVQVPGLPQGEAAATPGPAADLTPDQRVASLEEALEGAQVKVERLVESLEEVRERRRYLENLRSDNLGRFQQIAKEVGMIQSSLDRIVSIVQEAIAERPQS